MTWCLVENKLIVYKNKSITMRPFNSNVFIGFINNSHFNGNYIFRT